MIDMAKTPEGLAIAKLQEIIEKAVDSEADSITIEYAKEGGLEVCFIFGLQVWEVYLSTVHLKAGS